MQCWILSFSFSWKERAKHLPWITVSNQSNLLVYWGSFYFFFFFHPPCSPVFQEVRSPEPVWRPGAAESEKDWHECSSTHCLSHARTHTPQASPCARTLAPHLSNCPMRSVPSCEVPRCPPGASGTPRPPEPAPSPAARRRTAPSVCSWSHSSSHRKLTKVTH